MPNEVEQLVCGVLVGFDKILFLFLVLLLFALHIFHNVLDIAVFMLDLTCCK